MKTYFSKYGEAIYIDVIYCSKTFTTFKCVKSVKKNSSKTSYAGAGKNDIKKTISFCIKRPKTFFFKSIISLQQNNIEYIRYIGEQYCASTRFIRNISNDDAVILDKYWFYY